MQKSTIKRIAIFIVISAVLVLAVVGGMRWAKGRAESYADKSSTPTAQPAKPETRQPEPRQTEDVAAAPPVSTPAPSTTPQSTPASVPATGPQEVVLSIMSLSILAFAATRYVQARRNLLSLR